MTKLQKQLFVEREGDAWLYRNKKMEYTPDADRFLQVLISVLGREISSESSILEIGCGAGNRLLNLVSTYGCNGYGLDPSSEAIHEVNHKHPKLQGFQGTADKLPFPDNNFDIVCFGSCLMWIDICDLFTVASEAFRVAKEKSILSYRDFYSRKLKRNPYHHDERIVTTKMDFTTMFTWHPSVNLVYHEVVDHRTGVATTIENEFTSHAILRVNKNFACLQDEK